MGNNRVDMHTHSNYSDGDYTPDQLILKGKKSGLKIMAITDHDTLLGNQNITLSRKEKEGIIIIPGIELSAYSNSGRMHILGYDIDIYNETLNNKTIELKNKSLYSVIGLITQLKKDYNIVFKTEDIQRIINTVGNIGRPNLARLCIKYGYSSTINEAFDKYLQPAYQKTKGTNKGISYQECIDLINIAGGIAVLAHPYTLNLSDEKLEAQIKSMIECGLRGIEAYHSNHTPEETKKYLLLAEKYNLLVSGGSDYHGPHTKPDIHLGTGKNNNLKIKKLTLLEHLQRRL